MSVKIFKISILFLLLVQSIGYGQKFYADNRRMRVVSTDNDTIQLDSMPISPASVSFSDKSGFPLTETPSFKILYNLLIWEGKFEKPDSVRVNYRVLDFPIRHPYRLIDSSRILAVENTDYIGFDYTPYRSTAGSLFDGQELYYNGSFVRGLTFGNNQNLAVNSNFNLQMNGKLGDDIEILASISDNNIPVQPEGNTQQLQEFDRIYIQLKKEDHSLLAGDYELNRPVGYFINYYKKLQGASFSTIQRNKKGESIQTSASLAVARGKFARNLIQGEEGNQGPYKLKGAENEQFITVLSGTEKIYIDGELLQRGVEYDYVIDYNRGDISFTNKRLITKDIRIIAEFEYADRQYLRSLYSMGSIWTHKKGELYFNFFSQQDSKHSGGAGDLSELERQALKEAGDIQDGILVSGVREYQESLNPVQYVYIPNPYLLNGDSILAPVQIADGGTLCSLPEELEILLKGTMAANPPLLAVRFSQVNAGQGWYRRCQEAFGTVFIFSPPDSAGNLTGDYIPFISLTPPEQQQMYSIGGVYQTGKKGALKTEVSMSRLDLNRFSSLDAGDDQGMALRTDFHQDWDWGHPNHNQWTGQLSTYYERTGKQFNFLNPYRNAEFSRDWLLEGEKDTTFAEQLAGLGFQIKKNEKIKLGYEYSGYRRGQLFDGRRHTYDLQWQRGIFKVKAFGTETTANSDFQKSSFSRPRLQLSATFPTKNPIEAGIYGEREKSLRLQVGADTLLGSSFHYDLTKAYLKTASEGAFQLESSFSRRWDYLPSGESLEKATEADIFNIKGNWQHSENATLSWNFNIRDIRIEQPELTKEKEQRTYLGRLDYALSIWKGALKSNTSYEIGSGQEQRVEFVYQRVDPGIQGTHYWNDRNDDGIIQIEEVELPPFAEAANLVRLPQLTGTFLRTDNVQFNQSVLIEPRLMLRGQSFWDKFFQKFSVQSAIRILRKTKGPSEDIRIWDPFQSIVEDSLLISLSKNIRHNIYFNRISPVWDIQLSTQNTDNLLTLGTGPDGRQQRENRIQGRWNINKEWSVRLSGGNGTKSRNLGELRELQDGNYQIQSWLLSPEVTWLARQNLRATLRYEYEKGKNEANWGGEKALQSRFIVESVVNTGEKAALRLNISLVQIDFEGINNTPASFALMNGLQGGRNYLWNFSLDRQLAQNILLNLTYEGRQSAENPIVHIGKAQLRANF